MIRLRQIRALGGALVLAAGLTTALWAEVVTSPGSDAPVVSGSPGVQVDDSGTIQRPKASTGQTTAAVSLGKGSGLPTIGKTKSGSSVLDYVAWDKMAQRAEAVLATGDQSQAASLDRLRGQLADWREALLGAENANAARIDTLRQQISALGPAPATGETEAEEIAKRRVELSDQLVRLQAPGIAAEEAYRRADGLIAEIDRVLRERQATELLKLWPSPAIPTNWTAGFDAIRLTSTSVWAETTRRIGDPAVIGVFLNALPLILFYLVLSIALLARGQRWTRRLIGLLQGPSSARAQRIWGFMASLSVVIMPVLGLVLLSQAFRATGMLGPVGLILLGGLGRLGFIAIAAHWIGQRAFPDRGTPMPGLATTAAGWAGGLPLNLTEDERGQARFVTTAMGVLLAVSRLRRQLFEQLATSDAAAAVIHFPILVIGGILLWRLGGLLRRHQFDATSLGDEVRPNYRDRSIGILGRAVSVIGIIGPVLAAIGYIAAAQALIFSAALSLGLMAVLVLVQRLISDVSAMVTQSEQTEQEGLVPVLIGFALTLATLPLFALIWGARISDLTELWTRFKEGFQLGETQISPTDFLIFVVIFGIGLTLTRLLQGTLKASVLPRTGMDQGGQNAVVSGLGYLGIFLSALVAINSTGIDLSGLAIVAGALSVGIGFGLQTIVSNFVSGVILLIERPVSEGDWIEVGPVQGIVKSISVRSTRIQTFERSDVIVPNSDLITGRVTNWTRFNLTGRLIVPVAVPFTSDSRQVEKILREIAEAQPMVLLSPPPLIMLAGFGGEVMNFEIRVILRDAKFQWDVRSEINHMIVKRFGEAGIKFSSAHRDYLAAQADAPAVAAAAEAEQRASDALLAALMGPEVGARVRAARDGAAESEAKP